MKKTFRKAIAVILAVLMVAFSVPFSAFAANFGEGTQITANRKWWVDAGVDPSTIKETPTYTGFNELQELVKGDTVYVDGDNADLRNEYKPVIAVTVSKVGTNAEAAEAVSGGTVAAFATKYYNKYYAASGATTYDAVKAAGNIVNPAQLKAGDRIVVTVEFGGFDILCNGQFKGNFDTDAITPAYYAKKPSKSAGDTWKQTDSSTINVNTGEYANTLAFAGKSISGTTGVFTGVITGQNFTNGDTDQSNFFNRDDNTTFGKYGVPSFAYGFEVLKDCDLKDVFHFDRSISGTEFEPYSREGVANYENPELYLITGDDTKNTFANWTEIWSEYEKAEAPSIYTIKFKYANGGEEVSKTVNAGEMPTAPETNTPQTVESDNAGHHTVTTYTWPTVEAATADRVYEEVANPVSSACSYERKVTLEPTYTTEGEATYTCTVCKHSYTEKLDKLVCDHKDTKVVNATKPTINKAGYTGDTVCNVCGETIATGTVIAQLNGEAYRAALKDAQSKNAKDYTEASYAKVTAALKDYAEDVVATYTDPADVAKATKALQDAVTQLDPGVVVTVASTKLGTTTLNDADATNGANARLAVGDKVVLTAKANNETGEFVGWKVGNKIVSDEATFVTYVTADITYEPVFAEKADTSFTVVFVDPYGNVIDTQTVDSAANITVPTEPPVFPGYTFTGWSMNEEEISKLTDGATIYAQYKKDEVAKYTVTANDGATITVNGAEVASPAQVAYDTKVSVHKDGAQAWKLADGTVVGYGDTYTFFCGSDIELTPVMTAVQQKTTVKILSATPIEGTVKVSFLATRNVAPGETVVKQGFIYGKNLADSELTLENVGNKGAADNAGTVKILYNKNSAEQIALDYGLSKRDGKISVRAFVITKADGTLKQPTMSDVETYTY